MSVVELKRRGKLKEKSKVEEWVKGIGWGIVVVMWIVLWKIVRRVLG